MEEKKCLECGKVYGRFGPRWERRKYCSKECLRQAKLKKNNERRKKGRKPRKRLTPPGGISGQFAVVRVIRDPEEDFPRGAELQYGICRDMLKVGYWNPGTVLEMMGKRVEVRGNLFERQELVEL